MESTSKPATAPWLIPVGCAVVAFFAVLLVRVAGVPVATIPIVTTVGAVAHGLRARRHRQPRSVLVFACGLWVSYGAWATVTAWLPTNWGNPTVLLCQTLVAALFADPVLIPQHTTPSERESIHPEAVRLRDNLDDMWKTDPEHGIRWAVTKFALWPGRTGYRARISPPRGYGITLTRLKGSLEELAAAMHLREGCTIRVDQAEHAGAFFIEVMLVNMLGEDRTYPTVCRRGTILEPKTIGWHADGSPLRLDLHQKSTVAVAQRGGGKTVLMHGIIAELVQCTDTLVAIIDMNGAGLAVPWMRPYVRGEVAEPPIQVVANGEEAALEAAAMFLAMAYERKVAYAALMAEKNADVLPVSADLPHWTVIIDEGGEIFGPDANAIRRAAGNKFLELQRVGRAACVNVIFTSQRGTTDYISSSLKKATFNRLAGPVQDDAELGHVLDWENNRGISYRDLTGPGQWFTRIGHGLPRKAKSYRLLPSDITAIAKAVQHWRPQLDPASARAGGRVWEERFERIEPWLLSIASTTWDPDAAPVVDVEALLGRPQTTEEEGFALADDIAADFRERVEAAAQVGSDDDGWADAYMEELDQIAVLAEPRNTQTTTEVLGRGPAFALALVRATGSTGIRTQDIYTAARDKGLIGERRATVNNWLSDLRKRNLVQPLKSGLWVAVENRQTGE